MNPFFPICYGLIEKMKSVRYEKIYVFAKERKAEYVRIKAKAFDAGSGEESENQNGKNTQCKE